MSESIKAEMEIDSPDGKRTIKMELKQGYEIEDCEIDKAVVLNLVTGETYIGIFKGMDGDEDIMFEALSGEITSGLKVCGIHHYFEQC